MQWDAEGREQGEHRGACRRPRAARRVSPLRRLPARLLERFALRADDAAHRDGAFRGNPIGRSHIQLAEPSLMLRALPGLFVLVCMVTTLNARAELRENIEYGQAGGVSLRLDAEIPRGAGPFPAAIIVHGGAWVTGDRRWNVQPLFRPLTDAGFAWFSISYRLADNVAMFGDAVQDVEQAVRYVHAHAAEFHVDPDRVALIGESAGAQLAAMAALNASPGDVRAVVSLYGPTDLVTLAKTSKQIPESVRRSVQGTPFESMLLAGLAQLSPINHVRGDMPPFLLIHGTSDSLVPFQQSVQFCEKAREAGGACELYPVSGGGHGIHWWEASHLTAYKQHMVRWLEREMDVRAAAAESRRRQAHAGA